MSLVGIVLVVANYGAHRFVFSYPEDIERQVLPLTDYGDLGSAGLFVLKEYPTSGEAHRRAGNSRPRNHNEDGSECPSSKPSVLAGPVLGFDRAILSNILTPRTVYLNSRFELELEHDLFFLGHPIDLCKANLANLPLAPHHKNYIPNITSGTAEMSISIFHLVLVVQDQQKPGFRRLLDTLYKFIRNVSAVLAVEQLRSDYIGAQAEIIANLANDGKSYEEIKDRAPLARNMVRIFDALKSGEVLQLDISPLTPFNLEFNRDGLDLRPHQAVLLFEDEQVLRASLPPNASPTLRRFIEHCSPFINLFELSQSTGILQDSVFALVEQLVYWRKAKVVLPVTHRNRLVVHRNAELDRISELGTHLKEKYDVDIWTLLDPHCPSSSNIERLSATEGGKGSPLLLSSVIPSKSARKRYLSAVTYLMRKNIVCQIETFVYLLVRCSMAFPHLTRAEYINALQDILSIKGDILVPMIKTHTGEDVSILTTMTMASSIANVQRSGFSGSPYSTALSAGSTSPDNVRVRAQIARTFRRLIPYLDGRTSTGEMALRENIKRSLLSRVLETFRRDLLFVQSTVEEH